MSGPDPSHAMDRLKRPLITILAIGLAVRLALMPWFNLELDLGYWVRITGLLDAGFTLYDTVGYYYTPIWGYVVGLSSFIGSLLGVTDLATFVPELTPYVSGVYFLSEYVVSPAYSVTVKLPIILADTVTAFLLYDLVKDITNDRRKAVFAFALWYLCPFVILISSVHGMFDSISAMLILLTISFVHKRRYILGGVSFSLAVLTKFFPVFFVFFLIAYVLKREGLDRNGVKHLLSAFIAAVVTLFAVQFPALLRGQFWESMFFLTDRVGLSTDLAKTIFSPKVLPMILLFIVIVCAVIYLIQRRKGAAIAAYVRSLDPKVRDRYFIRGLVVVGILLTISVIIYTIVSIMGETDSTVHDILVALGMKGVMILSLYTILLEIYLAYRMFVSDGLTDRSVFRTLMLSSIVIFLWPGLPQYLVVIVPFLVAYAAIVDEGFTRPFMVFSLVIALYEVLILNGSIFFTLAIYTDLVPLSLPLTITDWMVTPILGMPLFGFLMGVFVIFEYLAMLGMFLYWYRNRRCES
jgi:hypothetical protein